MFSVIILLTTLQFSDFSRLNARENAYVKKTRVKEMESVGLKEEYVLGRTKWKNDIQFITISATPDHGKSTSRKRRRN